MNALFAVLLKVGSAVFWSTVTSFVTEKRVRKYLVYFMRWIAERYPESQWPQQVASDLEKDWEAEYKEDI